jgi:glyoxylate reductase
VKSKVYCTRKIPQIGIDMLKKYFEVQIHGGPNPVPREELLRQVTKCEALVCLLDDNIDKELMDAGKKLKIIAMHAVGYNNIDIEYARVRKIMVTNTPGVLTRATSEIAFALLITLTRRIIPADRFMRDGKFEGWQPLLFLGDELKGKTIGIIGMGRIGQDMASLCKSFGMNIIYHNRNRLDDGIESLVDAHYVDLNELLGSADVISIHTPLTNQTRHLINEDAFSQMKEGVYLINAARGEIVKESALVDALKSGKLKGAGLDVYEFEPEFSYELVSMENVVLLPHIGSATLETRNKMSEMAAQNVIASLEGRRPPNLVPELANEF